MRIGLQACSGLLLSYELMVNIIENGEEDYSSSRKMIETEDGVRKRRERVQE
jgi:hypothetical protein